LSCLRRYIAQVNIAGLSQLQTVGAPVKVTLHFFTSSSKKRTVSSAQQYTKGLYMQKAKRTTDEGLEPSASALLISD
jgi:hypothetical protein